MKVILKNVYYCEYCNKRYLSKYFCKKHEDTLYYDNPKFQSCCFGCSHLDKKTTRVYTGQTYIGSETYDNRELFFCNKKLTFLYPRQFNGYDVSDDYENTKMPVICELLNTGEIITGPISDMFNERNNFFD